MLELPLIKAEDTTEDVMATAPTVLHITDIAMAAGITVTTMYTDASSVAIKAVAAGIKEQLCLEERRRLLSLYMT